MTRVRSPNYPAIGLPDAIQRVEQVLNKESRHPAPKEVVVKHLGYTSVNGASLGVLSALIKYGLLEKSGSDYRVADRALAILHPQKPEERIAAIKDAAIDPALFADIADHFKGSPPSDNNLRAYLIRRNFSANALTSFVQAFRETIDLVNRETGGYTVAQPESPVDDGESPMHQTPASSGSLSRPPLPPTPAGEPMRVSITTTGLEVVARLSDREEIDKLIQTLEATKLLFTPVDKAVKPSDDEEGREAAELNEEIDGD